MNAAPFTTHAVSARDGTTIGYRQLGQGPGIVVLHGSMSSGYRGTSRSGATPNR